MAFAKNRGKKIFNFLIRTFQQKRGIMKVTIYKVFTYVHCLFVVAGKGVEEH
jgi:hypothetical protein